MRPFASCENSNQCTIYNNKISLWNNSIVKWSLLQQVIWNLIKSCLLLRHFGSISVRINLSIWISVGYKNQVCKFSFTDEGHCIGLRNSQAGPKMRIDSAVNKGTKLENSRSMFWVSLQILSPKSAEKDSVCYAKLIKCWKTFRAFSPSKEKGAESFVQTETQHRSATGLSLYGLCAPPCFCNPGLWVLQKLTSSNIYIDGEAKMWRQLSADKNIPVKVSQQLVSPWAGPGPLPVTFQANHCKSWINLSLIVSGVTVELLLCEKMYCPWTSSLRLKYSCNSKLPLPSSDRSDCVGWSVDESGIRIRSTKELFGSDTSLPTPEEYQRSTRGVRT